MPPRSQVVCEYRDRNSQCNRKRRHPFDFAQDAPVLATFGFADTESSSLWHRGDHAILGSLGHATPARGREGSEGSEITMSMLGLDIGTTGVKATAFRVDGKPAGSAYREYAASSPRSGWAEWDPGLLWKAVSEVIGGAAGQAQAAGDPVSAMAVCCLGLAFVPVDRHGQPTYPCIVTHDMRAEEEARWLAETFGADQLADITGVPLSSLYPLPKILWLRRYRPEVFAATDRFLFVHDYVALRLGCEPITDRSLASSFLAYDRHACAWSPQILNHANLDAKRLPEIRPSGTIMGRIGRLSRELGLSKDVSLVTGGFDQMAAALGAGAAQAGIAADSVGTVDCLTGVFPAGLTACQLARSGHPRHPHVVPGLDTTLAYCLTGGVLLRWYRDTFGMLEQLVATRANLDVYDLLTAEAGDGPSPVMVLPHFGGSGTPSRDPASKGAILGLTTATSRGEIIRAILEGINFEMRLNLESIAGAGVEVHEIRAVGGGARSPLWMQIKADVLGRRVCTVGVSEAGCLAMAMLAGVATGEYRSLQEAVQATVRVTAEFEPSHRSLYEEQFAIYRDVYPALRGVSHRL